MVLMGVQPIASNVIVLGYGDTLSYGMAWDWWPFHDDAMTWNRFPSYLTFCEGIHCSLVNSRQKGSGMRSFNISVLAGMNDLLTGRGRHLFKVRTLNKNGTLIKGRRTLI